MVAVDISNISDECFYELINHVKTSKTKTTTTSTTTKPTITVQLKLYGLYKRITIGKCPPKSHRPSVFAVTECQKFDSWYSYNAIEREEAKTLYVDVLLGGDGFFGGEGVLQGILDIIARHRCVSSSGNGDGNSNDSSSNDISSSSSSSTVNHKDKERPERINGLVCRGKLDICYTDLCSTLYMSLLYTILPSSYKSKKKQQYLSQISQLFSPLKQQQQHEVIVGYSVRSLFLMYLQASAFPEGSSVVLTPPIQIPGMIHIMKEVFGLNVIPVDIPSKEKVCIDIEAIRTVVEESKEVVAVMLVHPFGMNPLTCEDSTELQVLATRYDFEVWHDCAQAFTSPPPTDIVGDLILYSFGTIKSCTSLQGGIALVSLSPCSKKANAMSYKMKYNTIPQRDSAYMLKVLQCIVLQFCGQSLYIMSLVQYVCDHVFLCMDYDSFVTTSIKSKPFNSIQQYYPSLSNLYLLHRRLATTHTSSMYDSTYRTYCHDFSKLLKSKIITYTDASMQLITNPSSSSATFWLYPILCNDPDRVSSNMLQLGWDVPRGTTQLSCISSLTDDTTTTPNARYLMDHILYLPIYFLYNNQNKNPYPWNETFLHHLEYATSPPTPSSNPTNRNSTITQESTYSKQCRNRIVGWSTTILILSYLVLYHIILQCMLGFMLVVMIVMLCIYHRHMTCYYVQHSSPALFTSCDSDNDDNVPSPSCQHEQLTTATTSAHKSTNNDENDDEISKLFPIQSNNINENNNNTIVVTGATGFIGSLLFLFLLKHHSNLNIHKIILLCRKTKKQSATDRIQTMTTHADFIPYQEILHKLVHVIECDLTTIPYPKLLQSLQTHLETNTKITHVFHCASNIKFQQTLQEAALTIITPTLLLQHLTQSFDATFIYVSTAFVFGDSSTYLKEDILDVFTSREEATRVYTSMITNETYATSFLEEYDFPNTYTFAKCVCEYLLVGHPQQQEQQNQNTIIFRPSIVGPALNNPSNGWMGFSFDTYKSSPIVGAAALYLSYPWNIWSFGTHTIPVIPVDLVVQYILHKTFSSTITRKQVYNVCIPKSQITWIDFSNDLVQYASIHNYQTRFTSCVTLFVALDIIPRVCPSLPSFQRFHRYIVQYPSQLLCHFGLLSTKMRTYLDLPLLYYYFMNHDFEFDTNHEIPCDIIDRSYIITCLNAAHRWIQFHKQRRSLSSHTNTNVSSCCLKPKLQNSNIVVIGGRNYKQRMSFPRVLLWVLTQPTGNICIRIAALLIYYILKWTTREVTINTSSFSYLLQKQHPTNKRKSVVLLAPTHRSLYDNFLLGYVCFVIPELQIDYPKIVAAQEFNDLPLLGRFVQYLGAFFVKRGSGKSSASALCKTITHLLGKAKKQIVFEVFLEGRRSRDRRCIHPFKKGFLKSLLQVISFSKEEYDVVLVPLNINFEKIPDQSVLKDEICGITDVHGRRKSRLSMIALGYWLYDCFMGKIDLGRIHIEGGSSSSLLSIQSEEDVEYICNQIQILHQRHTRISSYHIRAGAKCLEVEYHVMENTLRYLSCSTSFWPQDDDNAEGELDLPLSVSELWTIMFQFAHLLSSLLEEDDENTNWAHWFNPMHSHSYNNPATTKQKDDLSNYGKNKYPSDDVKAVKKALETNIQIADLIAQETIKLLLLKGFSYSQLNHSHIMQYVDDGISNYLFKKKKRVVENATTTTTAHIDDDDVVVLPPTILISAAVHMKLKDISTTNVNSSNGVSNPNKKDFKTSLTTTKCNINISTLINTNNTLMQFPTNQQENEESLGSWGYKDSEFILYMSPNTHKKVVKMKGDRYSFSNKIMPNLVSFIENELKINIDPKKVVSMPRILQNNNLLLDENTGCGCCDLSEDDRTDLQNNIMRKEEDSKFSNRSSISTIVQDRLRHGTGHTQHDMCIIRTFFQQQQQQNNKFRIPDAVIYPKSTQQLVNLVKHASQKNYCLIPYGGGTNVSHALHCPPLEIEPRHILSVDMKHMNKILYINEEDGLAHVEAGITGQKLIIEMSKRGYTIGHNPDSYEFSTLGGWIATKSSGMKQARYGNIEDIVKSVQVIGGNGDLLCQHHHHHGRQSLGPSIELSSLMIGSEGCLGIITSAIIKIWRSPERVIYDSILLPSFDDGIHFMKEVSRLNKLKPASVRLIDNVQFRLGQAMKGYDETESIYRKATKSVLQVKTMLANPSIIMNYQRSSMVCVSIVFEGTIIEVKAQKEAISSIIQNINGALFTGSSIGETSNNLTFAIAYLRDFALSYNILSESFETFSPWSKINNIIIGTKSRLLKEYKSLCLPGLPLISCRISQVYDNGVCIYFYLCMSCPNGDLELGSGICSKLLSNVVSEEIIKNHGSLSHHHGIGKIRAPLLPYYNNLVQKKKMTSPMNDIMWNVKHTLDPDNIFGVRNGLFFV